MTKKHSKGRVIVLTVAFLLAVSIALFPPLTYKVRTMGTPPDGYGFVIQKPTDKLSEIRVVDGSRLFIDYVILVGATAVILVFMRR